MNEKSRANLRPWKPGESGNPSGRPRTAVIRTAFLKRAESQLPDHVREAIEKSGFTLPKRPTFADALAATIFSMAIIKGDPACCRIIHEILEGTKVVIDENSTFGPGRVADALNRIRELYGLEKIIDATPLPAEDVKVLPAPDDQATVAPEPDAVSEGGTTEAGDGAAAPEDTNRAS